jgi:hypothetical protein
MYNTHIDIMKEHTMIKEINGKKYILVRTDALPTENCKRCAFRFVLTGGAVFGCENTGYAAHLHAPETPVSFTTPSEVTDDSYIMTMRDQFAIAALNGVVSTYNWSSDEQASYAYELADAMMKAGKK